MCTSGTFLPLNVLRVSPEQHPTQKNLIRFHEVKPLELILIVEFIGVACRGQEPMIVVSPAGVLHAVNPVTRQTLWSYASGSDMGSVLRISNGKDSREINSSLDVSADDGESDEQIVYSGPDGKLYVLEGSQVGVSI